MDHAQPPIPAHPKWRRFVGLLLLGCVVVLWVASGFLASSIFADDTYSKPYLVTYLNTSFFSLTLIPFAVRELYERRKTRDHGFRRVPMSDSLHEEEMENSTSGLLGRGQTHMSKTTDNIQQAGHDGVEDDGASLNNYIEEHQTPNLTHKETFYLASKFCGFWFVANWFNSASYKHTTVASSTILVATSSVFTLLFGSFMGVEKFTIKKLLGVIGSLSGIILISLLDTRSKQSDEDRGSFPYKSPSQILFGDALALASAALYGLYATTLTKSVGDESRVNMPLFLGSVGLINACCFWPGFFILHFTGIEEFELPPQDMVWAILIINAAISLVSDVAWAYSVLLTSPLIVTVGLSLTIPLSLVGQMMVNDQYASVWYWFGAAIVVLSFVFVNYESKKTQAPSPVAVSEAEDV